MKPSLVILFLTAAIGCGRLGEKQGFFADKDPSEVFNQNYTQESFTQETTVQVKKSPVDIIFNVDNSGSMGDDQQALADNFSSFIDSFLSLSVDFNIAIITSDSATNRVSRGQLNSRAASRNPTGFKNLFKQKIKVGTGGSGYEKPAQFTRRFLTNHSSWPRSDAFLIVIIVSDEDDGSPTSLSGTHFANYLKGLKSDTDLVRVFGIIDTTYGTQHIQAVNGTGGTYHSINSPFDGILNSFSRTITELAMRFKLRRKLASSDLNDVKVFVDGQEQPRAAWTFHASTNSISFNRGYVPGNNSRINIRLSRPISVFVLKKRLDPSRLEKTNIQINGKTIPRDHWEYDARRNAIRFFDGHVPPMGSTIRITYSDRF